MVSRRRKRLTTVSSPLLSTAGGQESAAMPSRPYIKVAMLRVPAYSPHGPSCADSSTAREDPKAS